MEKLYLSEIFHITKEKIETQFKKYEIVNDIGEIGEFLDGSILEVSDQFDPCIVVNEFKGGQYKRVIIPLKCYIEAKGVCFITELIAKQVTCINGGRICADRFITENDHNEGVYSQQVKYMTERAATRKYGKLLMSYGSRQ